MSSRQNIPKKVFQEPFAVFKMSSTTLHVVALNTSVQTKASLALENSDCESAARAMTLVDDFTSDLLMNMKKLGIK